MEMPVMSTGLPVGGIPISSPSLVPRARQRVATRSSVAITSSAETTRSGIAVL
jgi:hypothetical protein